MKRKAGRSAEKEARCERRRRTGGGGTKSEGREKGEEKKDELAE